MVTGFIEQEPCQKGHAEGFWGDRQGNNGSDGSEERDDEEGSNNEEV
jgi:hypothetical protein